MAIKYSTALKNKLLGSASGSGSLKTLMDDGYIKIYSGTVPADADAALGSAVLLNTYSDNGASPGSGNGLDLETEAAGGAISKETTQVWKGNSVAGGVATFWRFVGLTDDGTSNTTTQKRMQGTVGGAGADLFVASTTIVTATDYTIDYFSVAIPNLWYVVLEKTTNSETALGIVGYVCVAEPAPPIPAPEIPSVPRPPLPGHPPPAPPVRPPGPPPVVTTYTYTDEAGNCWRIIDWGTPTPIGQPQIEKIPIECVGG